MEIVLLVTCFIGALAWGDLLVSRLMAWHSPHRLERALTGFGLLVGAGSFLVHILGFFGLLYKPLALAFVLPAVLGIPVWLASARKERFRLTEALFDSPSDRILAAVLFLFVAVNLVGCLTPEIRDDCLINHLSIPAGYANAHRIEIHPFNMNMGRPQLVHMYYLLAMLFQDVFAAKMIHSLFAVVGLAAMGWLAFQTCHRKALWPSLFLFYSLPVVTLYATCSYIDLARVYYEVFPLWLIFRYQRSQKLRDLVLAATVFGFGMGVHWLSSLFGWPILTATVFFAVVAQGGAGRWKRALRAALIFGAISAVLFAPWVLRNWFLMGNPCQALFRTPAGADRPQQLNPALLDYLSAIKHLPQRLYEAIWLISVSGNCPPLLLLIALGAKFAMRDRDPRRSTMLFFSTAHLLLFALTLPLQDGRYILPAFAVSVIVFFHYVEAMLESYGRYRRYLIGGVLALGLLNFSMAKYRLYVDYGEPPWPVYGRAACERFLARRFGDRSMVRYVNERLPAHSKVLLDDMTGPLYVWRPFMTRSNLDPRILETFLRRTKDNEELLQKLDAYGITHILIAADALRQQLSPTLRGRFDDFARRHLRLLYEAGGRELYEIRKSAGH